MFRLFQRRLLTSSSAAAGELKIVYPSKDRVGENEFIDMFRSMSPYINVHRKTTMVIHLPGEQIASTKFQSTMQDIALMNSFGIRLVLVGGTRPQVNERLKVRQVVSRFDQGLRITGKEEMECVIDAAGYVRAQLERSLGRGVINAPGSGVPLTVSSGNFVTAQPIGIRNGVDLEHSGLVRRINVEKINRSLDHGEIVVVSNLGYSVSGDVFNCTSEDVAIACATQLNSSKLIFFHEGEMLERKRNKQIVHSLEIKDAQEYVSTAESDHDFIRYISHAVAACSKGVKRVHLVDQTIDGSLLDELFTRDGSGLLIFRDQYEDVRIAKTSDITGILCLIQPLLEKDLLVFRNQDSIETKINSFSVVERDGAILACAALELYPDNEMAEMACVAVDSHYRKSRIGNGLLIHILRRAVDHGIKKIFVLTTATAHWFQERGFQPASLEDLPLEKLASIDRSRNSQVFILDISAKRAIDEHELLLDSM